MKLEPETVFQTYGPRLFSVAYTVCQNREDAEDAAQDAVIRYCETRRDFESEEHIKAWLIRVTVNRAKDIRSAFWRRNRVDWQEELSTLPFEEETDGRLFEAVMKLAEKYRVVIHMYYEEEYDIAQIARILQCPQGTVKSRLSRGRSLLKTMLQEEWNDDE